VNFRLRTHDESVPGPKAGLSASQPSFRVFLFDDCRNIKVESDRAVRALAALAQDSRLAIYRLLVQAGPAGLVAGQIGEALGIPAATLSFHLKTLVQGGLVTHRPEGRFVRYSADFATMHALIDYLSANCCGADRSRCQPAAPSLPKEKKA